MTDKKRHHDHQAKQHLPNRPVHKDWRLWAVVGLMLLSMLIYLLTMDESWIPFGGGTREQVPANMEDAP
jgi:hypothetical protein